jgi:hypothetical protein
MKLRLSALALLSAISFTIPATVFAQLDGQNLGAGQTLKFTQDTQTGFGNALGGGQDSAGGSEINQVWGDYDTASNILSFSMSGNLEGNFNKMFIFIDGIAGGENVLDATNIDGGFNEIQSMAGLTFDSGFTADHGLRLEIGDGFWGVNQFDLIDDTGSSVVSGGGPAELPLTDAGIGAITFGWDNSNTDGVTDTSALGADSATTGWEFEIDMAALLGAAPTQDINVTAFVTNPGGDFVSNQVIGGVGGAGNLGGPGAIDFNGIAGNQFVTFAIPEPSAMIFVGLGGLFIAQRRKR